jgi:hypothetical protein
MTDSVYFNSDPNPTGVSSDYAYTLCAGAAPVRALPLHARSCRWAVRRWCAVWVGARGEWSVHTCVACRALRVRLGMCACPSVCVCAPARSRLHAQHALRGSHGRTQTAMHAHRDARFCTLNTRQQGSCRKDEPGGLVCACVCVCLRVCVCARARARVCAPGGGGCPLGPSLSAVRSVAATRHVYGRAAAGHGPATVAGGCLLGCLPRRGGHHGLCAWRPGAAAPSGHWQWPGQRRVRACIRGQIRARRRRHHANPRPWRPGRPWGLGGGQRAAIAIGLSALLPNTNPQGAHERSAPRKPRRGRRKRA